METIHGKLVIRARFIDPSSTRLFIEPIVYKKHCVTEKESFDEWKKFQKVNNYDNDTHEGKFGMLLYRWIPYPERLKVD